MGQILLCDIKQVCSLLGEGTLLVLFGVCLH